MSITRSQEREQAFIVLFENIFNPDISVAELFSLAEESEFFEETEFSRKLVDTTVDHYAEIDTEIEAYTVGWSIQRITKVALAILRLAICEILYFDDIPASVSINEAVELAKKYAEKKDSSFINGVLGSFVRAQEQ